MSALLGRVGIIPLEALNTYNFGAPYMYNSKISIINYKKFLNKTNGKTKRNVYCCMLSLTLEKFFPRAKEGV